MKLKIFTAIVGSIICTSSIAKYTTDEAKVLNLQYRNEASAIHKKQKSNYCKEVIKMAVSFYDDVSMYLDMNEIAYSKATLESIHQFLGPIVNKGCNEQDRLKLLRINTFKLSRNI